MTQDRNKRVQLSEISSFSVEDVSGDVTKKKISILHKADEGEYDHLMLVIFPTDSPTIELPMKYNKDKSSWAVEIDRPKDVGELFLITTAKEPGKLENKDAPVLQQGFISLKNGKVQPVNKISGIPMGKLQSYLWTKNGDVIQVEETDEKKLKEGERFIKVYIPAGYDATRKKPYGFQVTLDGGQYLFPMQMDAVLDNLIESKEIEPIITIFISPHSGPPDQKKDGFGLVMPKGYSLAMRLQEYCCNPEFSDKLAHLPKTLGKQLNISDDSKHATIWGVSAGGLCAVYTALLHPEIFGNIVAESPMAWNIPIQNGDRWREGIVDKFVQTKDKEGLPISTDITWTTSTAKLPEKEGLHDEYLTQIVHKGYDEISKRKLDASKSLKFYFDAGDKEKEYHAEEGTANLVKATELLAEALEAKGHIVVDHSVHLVPGGHHNMTWQRHLTDAAKSMHSAHLTLQKEKDSKLSSPAVIAKKTGIDLSLPSESLTIEKQKDKNVEDVSTSASVITQKVTQNTQFRK